MYKIILIALLAMDLIKELNSGLISSQLKFPELVELNV